jgi:ubiquinone/menaquinone biosynthesis C-methylase UbiE
LDEQRHIVETFTEMATRYEGLMNNELNRFWGISYEEFVSDFLEGMKTGPDDTILDIATGTAYIPSYLIRHNKPFKKIIGLDLTFQMLHNANRNIGNEKANGKVDLVCGTAHELPLDPDSMDRIFCCLATHHMDIDLLLSNIERCLKPGGYAHLADVGGSSKWKNSIIRFFIKTFVVIYFIFTENLARAFAESDAIANIHTAREWEEMIESKGFENIDIKEMQSKRFWAPNPVIIKIQKPKEK